MTDTETQTETLQTLKKINDRLDSIEKSITAKLQSLVEDLRETTKASKRPYETRQA